MSKTYALNYGSRLEHAIVRLLVRELSKDGFKLHSVYDGGDYLTTRTLRAAMDAVFAVSESTLRFARAGEYRLYGVLLIVGNGEDVLSDWSCDLGPFSAAMDRICDLVQTAPLELRIAGMR